MTNGQKFKLKHFFWIVAFVIFGILIASLAFKSFGYQPISQNQNSANNFSPVQIGQGQINNSAPTEFYFIKNPNKQPNVKAESFLVGDLDTGEIILQKNIDQKYPIASVSKLFTATISPTKLLVPGTAIFDIISMKNIILNTGIVVAIPE